MPFALLIIGAVLVIAGVRGTHTELMQLLRDDFSGKHSYMAWMISILIIGLIGYVESLKPLSRAFLALVIVVLLISNGGFFDKFSQEFFGEK